MKKVIFVMGSGHCGSTLLDLLLGSHSDAFSLGEFHRLWSSFTDGHAGAPKICGVCPGHCEFWNGAVSLPLLKLYYSRKGYLSAILRRVGKYTYNPYILLSKWSGKSVLIDSSKQVDWIDSQQKPGYTWRGIEPYLIYICRDGRAVVNSYYTKYPEKGIEAITENWKKQTIGMEAYFNGFPPDRKIKVGYEELASDPQTVVESICNAVGMSYEPEMLRYWAHDHHHIFGNGGTRSLIYKYREQFETQSEALRHRIESSKEHYTHEYYDQLEVAISLDERWRDQLGAEELRVFNLIAGDVNVSCGYPA